MRFKDFLTESNEEVDYEAKVSLAMHELLKPIYKKISQECKLFLSAMGTTPVYRSSDKAHAYIEDSVRKDRNPLTSTQKTHELFDRWIEKETNIKGRSQVLFASIDKNVADGYGNVLYYVFPKNDFTCLGFTSKGKPVRDTLLLSSIISRREDTLNDEDLKLTDLEQVDKAFAIEKIKIHTFKKVPPDFNGELAIFCEEYFMVRIPPVFKHSIFKAEKFYAEMIQKIKEN